LAFPILCQAAGNLSRYCRLLLRKKTMKNILQNLLIFLALCLCVLIAFQWHREAKLRQEIQQLTDTAHSKREGIQSLEGMLKRSEEEVRRLDGLKFELAEAVKSNRTQIAQLAKDLAKSDAEIEKGQGKIEDYKAALQQANESINKQNEDIKKQNEELRKLAEERNESVLKYNKMVTEFNDLAKKWNDLQQQLSTHTNAPAKK
jgi:chromosome segregation ATPase